MLTAQASNGAGEKKNLALGLDEIEPLDPDTTVQLAEFIPDYVVSDGRVYTRSNTIQNPAARLLVTSRKGGKPVNFWLPPLEGFAENAQSPYQFEAVDLKQ